MRPYLIKRSVTELIAGKRQGNVVSSLMSNFDIARNALQTSIDSEDSAMTEHEKWMDSMDAKLKQFQAAFESLSTTTLDSDFLKGLIDGGTTLLNIFDKLIDKFGVLTPLIVGLTGYFSLKKDIGRNKMSFLIHCFSYMPMAMWFS